MHTQTKGALTMASGGAVTPTNKELLLGARFEQWIGQFNRSVFFLLLLHLTFLVDVAKKTNMLMDFRSSQEQVINTPEKYELFLTHCLKNFLNTLRHCPIHHIHDEKTAEELKFRNYLLETINRLPNNEKMRPYVPELLQFILSTIKNENETNATVLLRLFSELHKNFRPTNNPAQQQQNKLQLETYVQPFFDFVCHLYKELPDTVKKTFSDPQPLPRPNQGMFSILLF